MVAEETKLKGCFILEPKVFRDQRGYFIESFNKETFKRLTGITSNFVQDNESNSSKGVLRGLHFQNPPFAQAKLVSVIKGSVLDVAVDLRSNSTTYGMHYSVELNQNNHKLFFIPKGFAHGFVALEDDTIFSYKCSNFYNKDSEESLLWNDKDLAISWPIDNPIVSDKDAMAKSFNDFKSKFND